jgi:triacylglycerol lipase
MAAGPRRSSWLALLGRVSLALVLGAAACDDGRAAPADDGAVADVGAPAAPGAGDASSAADAAHPPGWHPTPPSPIVELPGDAGGTADAGPPPGERCNGRDDDGDGATDEDWPELGGPCDGDDEDLCPNGTWRCRADGAGVECVELVSAVEVCNGRDDDCDGETDEGLQDPDGDGVFDCPDYTKDPVLFVHGYMGGLDITWILIKDKLVRDGWPPEFLLSPTFRDVTGCNPEHGDEIQAWVRELQARTGRQMIDVVAHSMGGVDVRWYIKHRCGYRYIRDVVTLAGAHHGAFTGCLDVARTCAGVALCRGLPPDAWRDNPVLAEVNACDETPVDTIRYTSIWSRNDEIIVPQESSVLDGARNIRLESGPGHAGIVLEDEPYEWVKVGLDGGGWNDNVPDGPEPCYDICAPGL